jgi:predicted nucleic acid-binding protein
VYYFDASALVPLCVHERTSPSLRELAARTGILTWCLSAVEVASAVERRTREGALDPQGRTQALANLALLVDAWTEVTALAAVRERACRILATHAVRAADALQLAAALVAVTDRPSAHHFVCTDARLCDAAAREGFRLADL